MIFSDYLTSKRSRAESTLTEVLYGYKQLYIQEAWGKEVISRLSKLTPTGKLMRYALTQLAYEGYKSESPKPVQILGICLELVHTGFLFHDDIMDEDEKRRNNDSLHVVYAKSYAKTARNPKHLGEGLATSVADFVFFIVFDTLSHSELVPSIKERIISTVSEEFARVALAQMQDTYFGQTSIEPSEKEIIRMYRGKTGRYSVSLPLVCGAIVAGATNTDIEVLWKIGETLGLLYQIRDDGLSLFGDENITGKPNGSDIIQNKKTLHRHYLMTHADISTKIRLQSIFGMSTLSSEDYAYIQKCLINTGTVKRMDAYVSKLAHSVQIDIGRLHMKQTGKDILYNFQSFVTRRNT